MNCRFYHRVPQSEDIWSAEADHMKDIFGRSRHATFKENRTGIGPFAKDCKILCVSRIKFDDSDIDNDQPNSTYVGTLPANFSAKDMVRLVYDQFTPWGEVEDIIFNQSRLLVYVKYRFRVSAEFAREAMQNQVLVEGVKDPIKIQWAVENPFEEEAEEKKTKEIAEQHLAKMRLGKRKRQASKSPERAAKRLK